MEYKGEQIIKKELIRPLSRGIYIGSTVCEIWKYYRYSPILDRTSDLHFISFITKIDRNGMPISSLGEKIGSSFESVRGWTINKFPEFKEVF